MRDVPEDLRRMSVQDYAEMVTDRSRCKIFLLQTKAHVRLYS